MTALRRPAEAFRPGEYIQDEIDARGWSQTDLAEIMGRPVSVINEVISGKRGITPETAVALEAALDLDAQYWLNLETAYRLWQVDAPERDHVARRARLYQIAPVGQMIRRGWLAKSESVDVLEAQVQQYFELPEIDAPLKFPAMKSGASRNEAYTPAQLAWLYRARQLARAVPVQSYHHLGLLETIGRIRALAQEPESARYVPNVLAEVGVRFLIVQPLPGSKIDGACFWLDEDAPVITLSLRVDQIDTFWLVLMHELGHVLSGDESIDTDLAVSSVKSDCSAMERKADRFAVETLIPQQDLEHFINRKRGPYRQELVMGFAMTAGIHPGIVAGQLQHREGFSGSRFRKFLRPVRAIVTAAALTDGWGVDQLRSNYCL